MSAPPRRLIVGVTGATGIAYAIRTLEMLREAQIETHLVVTKAAQMTRAHETELSADELRALADVAYPIDHVGSAIASGGFQTLGMIVAPCSTRTLADIAHGASSNLLTRAADVCLKERRRLVLMLRETPLSLVHARAITAATEAGAIVAPPVPAFYLRPQTLEEMVDHTVGRVLDLFGIEVGNPRWGDSPNTGREHALTDNGGHP